MDYYFYSPIKALLYIPSLPVTNVGKNVLKVSAEEDLPFFIFCNERFHNICGTLKNDFADRFVSRYSFNDGTLFIPRFTLDCSAKCTGVLFSKEHVYGQEYLINAHIDGFFKLTVTGFNESSTINVPIHAESIETVKRDGYLIVILKGESKFVAIYSLTPLVCEYAAVCADFEIDKTATFSFFYRGALDFIKRDHYSLSGGFNKLGSDVIFDRRKALSLKNLAFVQAFFETARLSGDVSLFLHADLIAKKDRLLEFLGNIDHVIPPFLSDGAFALISDKLRFARVSIQDGKICDIDMT